MVSISVEQCLESWLQVGPAHTQVCPHCRTEGFRYIKSLPMMRRINDLRIVCPLRSLGCEETLPLWQVNDHLSSCGCMMVHCSNNCGEMVYRKDLNNHLQGCSYRPIRCQECSDITESHMTEESTTPHSTHVCFSWTSEDHPPHTTLHNR